MITFGFNHIKLSKRLQTISDPVKQLQIIQFQLQYNLRHSKQGKIKSSNYI